jgi:hypothetical protein
MTKKPPFRKLRGYAFDPSLSLRMDTAAINDIIYKIPWENVTPGPSGEYVEVVDYDPTVKEFYEAVNLNDSYVLAQDGLDPSESNPQFHQQMAYAVTMLTIKNFERALGRKILWSPRRLADRKMYEEYVPKLRVYPHAMREANAYYSPLKKALLFGYFSSTPADETLQMPDSLVFTCLSHDIIAHETTHAILDGMHNYYNEPTNPDMLAFHEAFADIVALFQHFTFPEVLKHQIAKTKGDLASQNLLGELAQQFGSAIGGYGSLRDAIGEIDPETNKWKPKEPNANDYRTVMEPHARGSILVAAVFEAFLGIYKSRISDLIRIASEGTGILRLGELHPDLVNRLANEASKAANHVLSMCIRGLDYCPPVDLTFGDYLRAIISADSDLVADDNRDYRLAFIDAFRKRGIYPEAIRTLSVESLRFPTLDIGYHTDQTGTVHSLDGTVVEKSSYESSGPKDTNFETIQMLGIINDFLRDYANEIKYVSKRIEIYTRTKKYIQGDYSDDEDILQGLHHRINMKFAGSLDFSRITGLAFVNNFGQLGINKMKRYNTPSFQIQNLRLVARVGPDGNQVNQVIFSLFQRAGIRHAGVDKTTNDNKFSFFSLDDKFDASKSAENSFEFRGGCTMIFDLDSLQLKYSISKPILDMQILEKEKRASINMQRVKNQYKFQQGEEESGMNDYTLYFGNGLQHMTEPFAFLHQH